MKRKLKITNEDQKFKEKIEEFLGTFTGEKEILDTVSMEITIELAKLNVPDEDTGKPTTMLCAYISISDQFDSVAVPCFFLDPPDTFQFYVGDHIYVTLSEAIMAYGKDIVRDSFAQAVKKITGKYPKEQVKVEDQIYGKPLDKTFIKRDLRPGRRQRADLRDLRQNYQRIFPIWEEAFDWYNTLIKSKYSGRKKEWKEEIKTAFPGLPENLILRLQPFDEYPNDVSAICSKNGGMNKPEDIALEHAAQLCGANPYAYRLSTLQKKLTIQKRESQTKE